MAEVWAKNNYEPSYDEIAELIDDLTNMTSGGHGTLQILPSMERYLELVEDVFWSRRRVDDEGHVWYDWIRP